MLKKWIKLSLLWLGLIALVLFHYVTGITPLILNAETFDSYVDYGYYTVANFDDYTPIINENTPNIDLYYKVRFTTNYYTEYCPLNGFLGNMQLFIELYNSTTTIKYGGSSINVNNFYCIEEFETYSYELMINLRNVQYTTGYSFESIKQQLLSISDNTSIYFLTTMIFSPVSSAYGYEVLFTNSIMQTSIEMRFNTNYLMSTFLLDSDWSTSVPSGVHRPFVLYTSTENDSYNVYNDNLSTSFTNRTKYAIEIPNIDAAIVVNKIGTGWETRYIDTSYTMSSPFMVRSDRWYIYTLNAAPMPTPFDDVAIDTTPNYSVCDYVLGFPIDCTLDGVAIGSFQAMANDLWEWTIKESPIFSDVWTLASGGFQWLSNTFQFLGYFDVDSLLGGVLALLIGVIVMLWAWVGG